MNYGGAKGSWWLVASSYQSQEKRMNWLKGDERDDTTVERQTPDDRVSYAMLVEEATYHTRDRRC